MRINEKSILLTLIIIFLVSAVISSSIVDAAKNECSDGIDNDGDGLVDYPDDPGCPNPIDNNEIDGGSACEIVESFGGESAKCSSGYVIMSGGWSGTIGTYGIPQENEFLCGDSNASSKCYAVCCDESLIDSIIVNESGRLDYGIKTYCPSGYEVVGGGFEDVLVGNGLAPNGLTPGGDQDSLTPLNDNGWYCQDEASNVLGSKCYAVCAKSNVMYTELSCTTEVEEAMVISENGLDDISRVSVQCPADSFLTGGGFKDVSVSNDDQDYSHPVENSWFVQEDFDDGGAVSGIGYARCCKLTASECSDGIDNDGDNLTDMFDPGCSGPEDVKEMNEPVCDDGIDNDGDNLTDMFDPGCSGPMDNNEIDPVEICQNGRQDYVKFRVDYTNVSGFGGGYTSRVIYVGGKKYSEGSWIPLVDDGIAIVDGSMNIDVTGIAVERGDGFIKVSSYGHHVPNMGEVLAGTITFNGSVIVTSINGDIGDEQSGFESQGDGIGITGDADQDEYWASYGDMQFKFVSTVETYSDTVYIYYNYSAAVAGYCYECDDLVDNDGDGLVDYPDDPGCSDLNDDSEGSDNPLIEGSCVLTGVPSYGIVGTGGVVAQCPAGTTITGGGWKDYVPGTDNSRPEGNGWYCDYNSVKTSSCWAVCCDDTTIESVVIETIGVFSTGINADCPDGYTMTGGGFSDILMNNPETDQDDMRPSGNGWYCYDDDSSLTGSTCYAVCAKAKNPIVELECVTEVGTGNLYPHPDNPYNNITEAYVDCPADYFITGGGFTDHTTGNDDQDDSSPYINGWGCKEDMEDSLPVPETCYARCCKLTVPECSDGIDNDDDGLVDYPDDLGCVNTTDDDESNDITPPIFNKTVGHPKILWNGFGSPFYPEAAEECLDGDCWEVTLLTPINMSCSDVGADASGIQNICFSVGVDATDTTQEYCDGRYNGTMRNGYCCVDRILDDFIFLEETWHKLDYYCVDNMNLTSEVDTEYFKVEGTAFEIPLYKKWNLISVPFVLLNDDPNEVFKDMVNIDSVWAYDSETGEWLVWSPEGPSSLEHILPGWGYWIMETGDEGEDGVAEWLTVGGSLMQPGIVPPEKKLTDGWNLIGYYGIRWQQYADMEDRSFVCGDENNPAKEIFGDHAYCALISLVDTQAGYPMTESLWSYVNCGEHDFEWYGMNIYNQTHYMYAGRGYWVSMNEDDSYVPSTYCPLTMLS